MGCLFDGLVNKCLLFSAGSADNAGNRLLVIQHTPQGHHMGKAVLIEFWTGGGGRCHTKILDFLRVFFRLIN